MNMMSQITKLLKGATAATRDITVAVDELRARRLVLLDERDRILSLPHERAEIEAAIDRDLDAMASLARAAVYLPSLLRGEQGPHLRLADTDILGLLACTNRDGIRAELVAMVDAALGDQDEVPAADRAEALARLADDIGDLERAEEGLVRAAEAQGLPILRRDDADPDTLLLADEELL